MQTQSQENFTDDITTDPAFLSMLRWLANDEQNESCLEPLSTLTPHDQHSTCGFFTPQTTHVATIKRKYNAISNPEDIHNKEENESIAQLKAENEQLRKRIVRLIARNQELNDQNQELSTRLRHTSRSSYSLK